MKMNGIHVNPKPQLLTTDEVTREVVRVQIHSEHDGTVSRNCSQCEISDAAALTIASWWMSPNGELSRLVHTGTVNAQSLLDDIHECRVTVRGFDADALDMLATWAINHPSREA